MVRPCVAREFVELSVAVLHQCIRPLIGSFAPGHHGYQRAGDFITGQASTGPFGSPVFARAGKTDPPSLRFLSLTSVDKQTKLFHHALLISLSSFVRARGRFFRPARTSSAASHAR